MDRKVKRRDFIKLSSLAALGTVVAACTPAAPTTVAEPTKAPDAPKAEATKASVADVPVPSVEKEAPMLAERVKAGKLPPIAERLPQNPLVVANREAVGVYGGELRVNMFDPVWWTSAYDILNERCLVYSDIDTSVIVPNIFESWEVSPDAKTWTIKMRTGMKWSDGDDFSAEDVRFWWEDFAMYKELNANPPKQFRLNGTPATFEVLDDYTFRFIFDYPYGNFAAQMTRYNGADPMFMPSHYLKQFHAKYTDQAELEKQAKEIKQETWIQLFGNKRVPGVWGGPTGIIENPHIFAMQVIETPKEGLYIWERNPYYWKVDVEGNQLPYLDNYRFEFSANTEVTKLKIAQSELDLVGQHEVTMMDYPFYKDNEAKANYIVGDYVSSMGDRVTVFPNHTPFTEEGNLDEGLTAIVQDYRWKKALSMAIDREEINEVIFFGTARMGAMCPMPATKYYKEEYGNPPYTEYDPEGAKAMLDEMGLKMGPNGFRTRPDGSDLKYNLEHSGIRVGPAVPKITEMIVQFWREVGIDATTKEIQDSLLVERKRNSQVNVTVWHADRCTEMLFHIEPQWFIPTGGGQQAGPSPKWVDWYVAADRSADGLIEPPDDIKNLLDTYDQITQVSDENERIKLCQDIFDYLVENPLEIGLVLECPAPLLFNKNLRNLPKPKAYIGWDSYGLSTFHHEAFFYEGGVRA
jgi:peptide/nickel transport system substrate-binding protein